MGQVVGQAGRNALVERQAKAQFGQDQQFGPHQRPHPRAGTRCGSDGGEQPVERGVDAVAEGATDAAAGLLVDVEDVGAVVPHGGALLDQQVHHEGRDAAPLAAGRGVAGLREFHVMPPPRP